MARRGDGRPKGGGGISSHVTSTAATLLYVTLALLIGVYVGLNVAGAGIHHASHHDETAVVETSPTQQQQQQQQKLQSQYDESKVRIHSLEALLQQAQHEALSASDIHKDKGADDNCADKEDSAAVISTGTQQARRSPNPHPICQHHPQSPSSALALWHASILDILQATRLPNDSKFQFHDVTTELLQLITPRLPHAIKSSHPSSTWSSLHHAMDIAWKRYQYLQHPKDHPASEAPPRPLKILVMGGSLLVGTNCRKLLTELGLNFRLPKRDCTWSNRLDSFLNALFLNSNNMQQQRLVHVTKVAMGGTNTATGSIIWQYDLIPEEARNPDIVINAYSTNDMHILTMLEAQSSNVTLRDKVFDMTQTFVRQVLRPKCHHEDGKAPPPPPPLLLHIDDYLGNEQRTIWETTELAQGVQVLASYYGFTSVSYADVVRDLVYGDTHESWFSANWWETGSFEREIHPGMPMHIALTWVTAYAMLHMVTEFCSLPPPLPSSNNKERQQEPYHSRWLGLPELRGQPKQAHGKPKTPPFRSLPPILTKELKIEDVSALWEREEDAAVNAVCEESSETQHHRSKCPFSWVSGLSLQQNNETWIQEYFEKTASVWDGWQLSNDGGKLGFIPSSNSPRKQQHLSSNTTMELDFAFPQTIRAVTLFFMKSYGPKWANSRVELKAFLRHDKKQQEEKSRVLLNERSVLGFHDKNTSEMYTEAIELSDVVPVGSQLQVRMTLVGGSSFKILGLAICS